ncbi:hypothetical protein RhiirA1_472947 [Rhizophagus irregularis]|uniref:Uncharacterized protein n=1 Tax=Rhizophagus irregularis TaxID=588596 RepID=A0A2I1FBY3_9GLOM|nr:hypothetical protein RhiirA1_472947 [Rhizophagus irregularis]PKY31868.1 hypothetical protein RhiirB3_449688 [Rhizophagus irregularis]CAB4478892.1 unnamed protein product [Rhizophagus irregularis]CAB5108539.1 unnamed protein product [Rhizophagus irregularis]CAB5349984.1 unnamed protein product [Rhizophagus irregularis]
MGGSLDSVPFNPFNHSWRETLNGGAGLFALAVAIIFASIIIIVFIIRIIQLPRLRQQIINDFNDGMVDNTRSVPTRILKVIIFLLLTAGLVGVIYFNISKMIHDTPKISVTLIENNMAPSMLFCNNFTIISAKYYYTFNDISDEASSINITQQFSDITGAFGKCLFFNGTKFPKPISESRGDYKLSFNSDTPGIIVFIGDNNTNMDWTLRIPQGSLLSDVGIQVLGGNGGMIQYTETRHTALNESVDRSFQISVIEGPTAGSDNETIINVSIIEPRMVINQVEDPSLTLADLFSNVGGYLGIWGIFGFLFGSSKMDPFGFVARFVFIKQDRTKLLKELEKMKGDSNVELSTWEKEEKEVDIDTKTSNLSNQAEFKNLLTKYYVETDYYEHAVKTPENVYINKV